MGLQEMSKKTVKLSLILFGAVLIAGFQNCSSPKSLFKNNASGGGNGEGYSGMDQRAGLYYRVQPNFSCNGSPVVRGIVSTVEVKVEAQILSAAETQACTGVVQPVDATAITFPKDNSSVLTIQGRVFEKSENPPDILNPNFKRAFIHCRSTNMLTPSPNTDTHERDLIVYTNDTGRFWGQVTLTAISPSGTRSSVVESNEVTRIVSVDELTFHGSTWEAHILKSPTMPTRGKVATPIPAELGVFEFETSCDMDR